MNNARIVALSIDKVQTFLTETIHAHVQEKQTEEATLKNIMDASRQISIDFHDRIKEAFSDEINPLLSCSGVYVFSCTLEQEEIDQRLNSLFLYYYRASQGQKLLRCVSFATEERSEIAAIQEAKKRLKQSGSLTCWVEKNRDDIFSFCPVGAGEGRQNRSAGQESNYPMFARHINALFSSGESDNGNRFRIAVIKADLDGMGSLFQGISDYEQYCAVSRILNEEISLDGLHNSAKACPCGKTGWVFPFYIAGDDIFFAVSVENLSKGIDICRNLLNSVNERLPNEFLEKKLSMSVGVEITFNREPIRYYMEMVERQLKNAKTADPRSLEEFLQMKISIGGLTYLDIDYLKLKECKKQLPLKCSQRKKIKEDLQSIPIWEFFLTDVQRLRAMRSAESRASELLGTPGFFYTLLERINDETVQQNDIKYINSVLYHLLPEYIGASDQKLQKYELLLKAKILSQLIQMRERGAEIVLNQNTKKRLDAYLRLMLLFSDIRFGLSDHMEPKADFLFKREELENARKYLFTKSTDYLFNHNLSKNKNLSKIFATKNYYTIKVNGKSSNRQCFQRLKLEKSMFVKLRNTDKISIEQAANMIELQNGTETTPKDVKIKNEQRKAENKAPIYLYFDREAFLNQARKPGAWNADFVDSLMLLYAYIEMTIRYKSNQKMHKTGDSKRIPLGKHS